MTEQTPHERELQPHGSPAPVPVPQGWEAVNRYVWKRQTVTAALGPSELPPSPLLPYGGSAENFVFFDVETTGLSGGAGTLVFLIGLGFSDGKKLTIDQYFLRDYPGEAGFLDIVLEGMDPERTYISYNGKAFDTQILKTRCIMHGRSLPILQQLDLLYPARKLYARALASCSLNRIETHVLGIQRERDVPGALVPDIYFDFLKTGKTGDLEQVFAHHLQDIISLEKLLSHTARVLKDPLGDELADRCRLGRWLADAGFQIGYELLSQAFEAGDPGAGSHLAKYFKRSGDFEKAAVIWKRLLERYMDLSSAFELSKYTEHKTRDFSSSEYYARLMLKTVTEAKQVKCPESREAIEHRLRRIQNKMGLD